MIRTNEVFVHLSSTVLVHTSTKQAQSILQRRRDYTVDKQDLVRQQLDALKSRRVFADSEKEQDGVCTARPEPGIKQSIRAAVVCLASKPSNVSSKNAWL